MKNPKTALLCFLFAFGTSGPADAAPVHWSGNGHFYDVVSVPGTISWDSANAQAIDAGGYLATVTSKAENDFVFSLINNATYWHGYSGPWLGGFQSPATTQPSANWQWVTGEPWSYTAWQAGQPNDSGGKDENKLQYGFAPLVSTWNDIMSIDPTPSYRPVAYVIEVVPEPSTVALVGTGAFCTLAFLRKRRAKATCKYSGRSRADAQQRASRDHRRPQI